MNLASFTRIAVLAGLSAVALGGGGCATPGPNHVYTLGEPNPASIRDTGPESVVEVPSHVTDRERVTGMAYDPYTDHLFLRLAPGNVIRVVDRPDRSIKREFTIPELPATGGDLTVRPRDGHLFFACPGDRFVVETDRFGKFLRRLELEMGDGDAGGIAYDAVRNRLLVAVNGPQPELRIHTLNGKLLQSSPLNSGPILSLAYDATNREIHAVVRGESALVVLNEEGKILRMVPAGASTDFVDLGQRSFVRVF